MRDLLVKIITLLNPPAPAEQGATRQTVEKTTKTVRRTKK